MKGKLLFGYACFFIFTICCFIGIGSIFEMQIKEILIDMNIKGDSRANLIGLINLGYFFIFSFIVITLTILFSSYMKVIKDK